MQLQGSHIRMRCRRSRNHALHLQNSALVFSSVCTLSYARQEIAILEEAHGLSIGDRLEILATES